jgi:Raf kinase inhibitor-like YbhB/YbcL family protein
MDKHVCQPVRTSAVGVAAALCAVAITFGGAGCRVAVPGLTGRAVAYDAIGQSGPTLSVTSPGIANGKFASYLVSGPVGAEVPIVQWSKPPMGTRSLVVVIEDPDAPGDQPYVHWMVSGIPASATSLGVILPSGSTAETNSSGSAGYCPPHPPKGDPPHHYHFEVFALDSTPAVPVPATGDKLTAAIKGHVIARGQLVATYQRP